jgi:chlorobactene glucosyltransferase
MMDALQIVILAAIAAMLAVALVNVLGFPALGKRGTSHSRPGVSVLIPARNEERTITAALTSLLAQDYPDFEVLVLDDDSADSTAGIVADVAWRDPRVRLLRGAPLEEGWGGKAFACHQLAREARGELLLFVDADTQHGSASIAAGVNALQSAGADLLSVIPHQRMVTFWEKVLLPLLAFSTFCYLPMFLIRRTKDPRLAMANGQYMLFRRAAYDAIGGHAAVRTALVEDVWLARLVKEKGLVLEVMDGGSEVSCRMYSSLRGIWNGFSKNLFAGFRYSLPAMLAVALFNLVVSVVPPVLAAGIPWFCGRFSGC